MIAPAELSIFLFALPVLVTAAALLLFANAAAAIARPHALSIVLANALLVALVGLILARRDGNATLGASQIILCTLAMLSAQIIAAPLLDRARRAGLLFVSLLGGLGIIQLTLGYLTPLLEPIVRSALLLVTVLAASSMALIGSTALRNHPRRSGTLAQGWMLVGYGLLAIALGGIGWLLEPGAQPLAQLPIVVSALVAALVCLLGAQKHRHPAPLRMAGGGLVAGILVALLAPDDLVVGVFSGIAAAFCVVRGERVAQAILLDDPSQLVGTLMLPAMLGLLLPGLLDLAVMADYLQWIGAALLLASALSVLLWPIAMGVFGLAASQRRVKEGFSHDA
jgi:hypothetical protein